VKNDQLVNPWKHRKKSSAVSQEPFRRLYFERGLQKTFRRSIFSL
jgi:hypothetical protein